MAREDINTVALTGNLVSDLTLRSTASGTPVATLRVASNARRKLAGEWTDKTNYLDVEAFGALGSNCAQYLRKGSRVAIEGELDFQEWTDQGGQRRSTLRIRAARITFEGARGAGDGGSEDSVGLAPSLPAGTPNGAALKGSGAQRRPPSAEDLPF